MIVNTQQDWINQYLRRMSLSNIYYTKKALQGSKIEYSNNCPTSNKKHCHFIIFFCILINSRTSRKVCGHCEYINCNEMKESWPRKLFQNVLKY